MKYIFLIIAVFLSFANAEAQSGRQFRPLFQFGGKYSPNGWHFGPGMTLMIPNDSERSETRLSRTETEIDTLFSGRFNAGGKPGIYLEVGRQHFVEDPLFIHYFDGGLHYKMLRGTEDFNGRILNGDTLLSVSNHGRFTHHYIGLYGNANHIVQLSDASFLQLSIGANVDYRVGEKRVYEGLEPLQTTEEAGPLQAQLHAKVAYGFRLESRVFIIPSVETPILNVYPFYDGKSTLPIFNSRYRPIIFSLRILILSFQPTGDCVGKGTEKRGDQLWGKDMRKRYNKR